MIKKNIEISELEIFTNSKNQIIDIPIDHIINTLDGLSKDLISKNHILNKKYPGHGVPFVSFWLQKKNLMQILNTSFKSYKCLNFSNKNEINIFPKGLVTHWIAGNVPTLGILSLTSAILTKNKSIIKLPSDSNSFFEDVINTLPTISSVGKQIYKNIKIIRYNYKSDVKIANFISKKSDVRIIWGSDNSCESILKIKKKLQCVDLIFSDRTSFIILDEESIKKDIDKICNLIALDVSVFEQKACASPHTIFVKSRSKNFLHNFCENLSKSFEKTLTKIPKMTPSGSEVQAIINFRSLYAMDGKFWASKGVKYSIFYDDYIKFGPNIGSRNVFVRKFSSINQITNVMPKNVQTAGYALEENNYQKFTKDLINSGVLRFKRIGSMTQFEIPWDGIDIPKNMVNYIRV
jgi:hypothetical protein